MTGTPLSIGIVLHDFSLGGTERIAVRLAQAWQRLGQRVAIICGSTQGPLASWIDPEIEIISADPAIVRGFGSRLKLAQTAESGLKRFKADICFIPGNFHWPVIPAVNRLPASRRPAVVAQISAALEKPQRRRLRQALFDLRMRRLLQDADALVAMSEVARGKADRIMRAQRTTTILLPALDDDAPPPAPLPADRTIVAAGRLVPEKGFADLIDAFARLNAPEARLIIVGSGPEEARLRARAADHGLGERVCLPGYAPDIRPWLDLGRIFVLSSHFEGYGAVVIEALAAGRPVVATNCTPAAFELLGDPDFGRVVPIRDVSAMATAMRNLLDAAPPDPKRLADAVQHHRIGRVAQDYLDLFARLAPPRTSS